MTVQRLPPETLRLWRLGAEASLQMRRRDSLAEAFLKTLDELERMYSDRVYSERVYSEHEGVQSDSVIEQYEVESLDQVNDGMTVWIQEEPGYGFTLERAQKDAREQAPKAGMKQTRVVHVTRRVVQVVKANEEPQSPERQVRGVTSHLKQTGNYEGHEDCPRIIDGHCMCGWML